MKTWLRRRDKKRDDERLRDADQRVVSLEARAAELVRGRFTEDHLLHLFRDGRRSNG